MTGSSKTIFFGMSNSGVKNIAAATTQNEDVLKVTVCHDSSSVMITGRISSAEVDAVGSQGDSSYSWNTSGLYPSTMPGEAALPQKTVILQLPRDAKNISLMERLAHWETVEEYPPVPARQPEFMKQQSSLSQDDILSVSKLSIRNSIAMTIEEITENRNSKFVYIHCHPFIYKENGKVDVCYDFEYQLTFNREKSNVKTDEMENQGKKQYELIDSLIDPWTFYSTECEKYRRPSNYLMITTDYCYENVYNYAKWKKALGHEVHIATSNKWSTTQIKDTIDALASQDPYLDYVMFIGSAEEIPGYNLRDGHNFKMGMTDYPYACFNGSKERSLYTGRLLLNHYQQLPTILYKLRNFYSIGVDNTLFHKRGTHISFYDVNENDSANWNCERYLMIKTSEDIRSHMMVNGKTVSRVYRKHWRAAPMYWNSMTNHKSLLPDSLQYPRFPWNADTPDVVNAFNNGGFYMIYNGHGADDQFFRPNFTTNDISSVYNYRKWPFLFSMSCATGDFISEKGLIKNLLFSTNGVSSAVGASVSAHVGCVDAILFGMIKVLWSRPLFDTDTYVESPFISFTPEFVVKTPVGKTFLAEDAHTLGRILDYGVRNMQKIYNAPKNICDYDRQNFHIYGDPGVYLNTDTPTEMEGVSFKLQNSIVLVAETDQKAKHIQIATISLEQCALIGYYNESTNEVARYYTNSVTRVVSPDDRYHFTITKINKIPFELNVSKGQITANGPYNRIPVGFGQQSAGIIESVTQTSPINVDVRYALARQDSEGVRSLISIRDMSNNILSISERDDCGGTVSLSSPKIVPGYYVVTLQSEGCDPVHQKILIK